MSLINRSRYAMGPCMAKLSFLSDNSNNLTRFVRTSVFCYNRILVNTSDFTGVELFVPETRYVPISESVPLFDST